MWNQNAKEPEFEFMLLYTSTRLSHFHAWGCELLCLWLKALEWPIRVSQIGHKEYQQGVCVTLWPCHSHFKKSILRQKKNYGNSNISPCKNIIFKKNPLKETKSLQDIIISL